MTQIQDKPQPQPARERYRVSVEEYRRFREQGFLVVRGLLTPEQVLELQQHTEDLMQGKLPQQTRTMRERDTHADMGVTIQDLEAPPEHLSPEEKADYFLRVHMLHRQLELHERYLLHPRVLDVLEALIGPDLLALQSMLFLKGPGKPGQGWHQDSYYIPTFPDSLCGAWIAIDDVDEYNGAMWFAAGSHVEPVYPPPQREWGFGETELGGIEAVDQVSNPDDEVNGLAPLADRYPQLLASARAGDVVFFGGHILHRSKRNMTPDRLRRSFVGHYMSARSFTQWGADDRNTGEAGTPVDPATLMSNSSHILARGDTHLPFARPRFGTPCAALETAEERRAHSKYVAASMGDMASGDMGLREADPTLEDDD